MTVSKTSNNSMLFRVAEKFTFLIKVSVGRRVFPTHSVSDAYENIGEQ